MKLIVLSFFFIALSFNLCIAKEEKGENDAGDETLVNVPKRTPSSAINIKAGVFNIDEVCKGNIANGKCTTILKSLGGDKNKVKPSKFSDKVVKHAQDQFGHTATKARKEMREDDAKVEVKKALSRCVKLYLDMNNELRGLYAVGLKTSNYGAAVETFSGMAKSYPKICEDGLVQANISGQKLGLYENFKDLEDLGVIVDAVTRYVSASSKQKAGGDGKKE